MGEITTIAATGELDRLFGLQRAASRNGKAADAALRQDRLARLARLLKAQRKAIAAAISADFGTRSAAETDLLELVPSLSAIRHATRHLSRWMRPEKRPVELAYRPGRAYIRREPLGVIGIISPWNYPLLLAIAPLVDALAAGNRVLLKPSELTPRFAEVLKAALAGAFAEDEVAVITGGVDVAEAFSRLPFDHLVFTGSTATGRKVMRAAAENLTPVTLELGGKSPAIVCEDYPVKQAARSIAQGKFVNAGQTCIAPDYVLVPKKSAAAFAKAMQSAARRAYPRIAGNPDYSAIISPRHHERLRGAIEEARVQGATILAHEDEGSAEAGKIGPTLVLDPPPDGLLMREEIFGPVLPILAYDDLDQALAMVAARERPLALYCFSNDEAVRERVLDGAISGGVTLNGTLLHIAQDSLPFGGIGASGMGAYHGEDGFRRFSHARAVFAPGRLKAFERLGPPWGRLAALTRSFMTRR